ncbi:hypothetical protein BGW41_003013 [Actinomortierella wolfii]|nr:hypothetical protein BGW41_003013 [Actinomortierella wolfii]
MTEAARQKALESFLASPAAQGYGYNGRIDTIRQEQYPQIKDAVYLDHAGATLPAQSTIQRFTADLTQNLYANPHSKSPSSLATSARINSVRRQILEHFNASTLGEWDVIFTSNATAAIKLVGEAFPWTRTYEQEQPNGKASSRLLLFREAHTSVVGLRALADDESRAIQVETVDRAMIDSCLNDQQQPPSGLLETACTNPTSYNMFAYPAQCNFSGRRFPLSWAHQIRQKFSSSTSKTLVLLDAASYVMTSPISLENVDQSPDFMVVSFYKMFGFPTGLGCLIVKTEHRDLLQKQYFGGGTVSAITSDSMWQVYRDSLHGRFEDGTLNFMDIIALDHAFASTKALYGSFANITPHVSSLHQLLYNGLRQLKHWNGTPVCTLYIERAPGDKEGDPSSLVGNPTEYGPIVNFNLKQSNGKWIGYGQVERLASMKGIHVRTGGFCNPGSMQRWLELSSEQVKKNLEAGHVCWNDTDILDEKPTGSIRVSLGAMSTAQDVLYLLDFLSEYFVETSDPDAIVDLLGVGSEQQELSQNPVEVDSLIIYPIKSCRGYKIPAGKAWPIEPHGLRYDREWMLVDATTGAALTQKRFPRMCLIRTEVLLEQKIMVIEQDEVASTSLNTPPPSPRLSSPALQAGSLETESTDATTLHSNSKDADDRRRLIISLDELDAACPLSKDGRQSFQTSSSRVCGDCTKVISYEDPQIHEWFSTFLGHPCRLVRQPPPAKQDDGSRLVSTRHVKAHLNAPQGAPITLTNESPFLLISDKSVERVQEWIDEHDGGQGKIRREALTRSPATDDDDDDGKHKDAQRQRHQFTSDSFRGNFVTRGQQAAFEEDRWSRIQIGRQVFDILGPCRRCHMVTIDQKRATKNNDVFLALSKHRKGAGGQIFFGMHMLHRPDLSVAPYQVQVGDLIRTLSHSQ